MREQITHEKSSHRDSPNNTELWYELTCYKPFDECQSRWHNFDRFFYIVSMQVLRKFVPFEFSKRRRRVKSHDKYYLIIRTIVYCLDNIALSLSLSRFLFTLYGVFNGLVCILGIDTLNFIGSEELTMAMLWMCMIYISKYQVIFSGIHGTMVYSIYSLMRAIYIELSDHP